MKKTKKIPRKKLVQGDEVGQPREMTCKAPKGHLKLDGRISQIVRWGFCHISVLIEAPETCEHSFQSIFHVQVIYLGGLLPLELIKSTI